MLSRLIGLLIANAVAFLGSAYIIPNFDINLNNITAFVALIVIFSAIQLILRPFIKLILTPLIIITLGLFNLVITGGILYVVDKYSENISINGLMPLIYGTLIITAVNMLFGTGRNLFKED